MTTETSDPGLRIDGTIVLADWPLFNKRCGEMHLVVGAPPAMVSVAPDLKTVLMAQVLEGPPYPRVLMWIEPNAYR